MALVAFVGALMAFYPQSNISVVFLHCKLAATTQMWYSQPNLLYNFDIFCLAIIPSCIVLQLVRSNSRRFMPSQADEEIHQLSYLQKHMANILTLLADSVEGEGDDSLVWHLFFSVVCFGREIHHVLFSDFHTRVS